MHLSDTFPTAKVRNPLTEMLHSAFMNEHAWPSQTTMRDYRRDTVVAATSRCFEEVRESGYTLISPQAPLSL